MGKKILLTGTNGFIGRNLEENWSGKYNIICPKKDEINLLDTENVINYIENNSFDIIIHVANINNTRNVFTSSYESLDGNLRMFFNLECCKKSYDKMFYFGSGAEFDMRYYIPEMKENYFGRHVPKDPYGFSKYIMSKVSGEQNNIYDLRLFGVYGKYEEWERRFISNAICRVLLGKNITIQKNVYFDYLWVDDLCKIMEWFINNEPKYKHYNVCKGEKIDLYSLACVIRETLNVDCDIIVGEPGWKSEYTGNNDRLLNEIGDFNFSGYKETIKELYGYYKSNLDMIDGDKLI